MTRWIKITSWMLGLALAVVPAAAQVQSGQGGHALDANTQQGTGGLNTIEGQVDYRARNDIITGNVSGGRAFQDGVGYGAPGAFGLSGHNGSSTSSTGNLFNFERNSLASSPQRLNNVSVGGRAGTQTTGIYRTFTEVLPYQTGYRRLNPTTLLTSSGVQAVSGSILNQSRLEGMGLGRLPAANTIGYVSQPQGDALQVRVTPLLGVRSTRIPGQQRLNPETPDLDVPDLDADGNPILDASLNSELKLSGVNTLSSGIGTTGQFAQSSARIAPGLIIGQQLRMELEPTALDETFDDRAKRLEQSIFGRTDSTQVQPGEDVYMDLLHAVKGDDARQVGDVENLTATTADLEVPDQETLQKAEQSRRDALAQAYGIDGNTLGTPPNQGTTQETEPNHLSTLLDQLNYNLPQIETLAGSRKSQINSLLGKAEADLAGGRYFAAEGLYRQVMTQAPDNPLGLVGLTHAQLGAGMIRSAAFNLRRLCETHPELIAARYSANLLPQGDRLKWVQSELQRMINNGQSTSSAGLMMAYLGYQIESTQLIRYGLAVAQAHAPRDTLIPVVRAIWLDETQSAQSSADDATTVK